MNPLLKTLQPYPFEKLNTLKAGCNPPVDKPHIALSIGEPKHPAPAFVLQALADNLNGTSQYPATKGIAALREAMASWAIKRFSLKGLDCETQILPVNGTREALFAFPQTLIDASSNKTEKPFIAMPNPFYQIYEGAALLAGAEPYFLNCAAENNFLPDFTAVPAAVWQRTQLLFICSPGNPTGSVIDKNTLKQLIALADQHDFVIASDECYSELYLDEQQPPTGLLEVCAEIGRHDFKRCVVFHSLSKRSNLPGMRSGFVAGDAELMQAFLLYRTYHGAAMPPHHQLASISAWQDEEHVVANRAAYREKFLTLQELLNPALEPQLPAGGFYYWLKTPISDTEFARGLFDQQNVTVLPGSFLARDTAQGNPGANRVRIALVAPLAECIEAAQRINTFVASL
jgi:N-succinyldiaminopimelate aminotransferase